jgi:hypothetical protein
MSYVNIVRLTSGEEIICQYEELTTVEGVFCVLKNPAILIPNNEGKLMFAKWVPYMKQDDGVKVLKSNTLFAGEPMDDLREHYMTVIVNNLFIPQKKLSEPQLKLALD